MLTACIFLLSGCALSSPSSSVGIDLPALPSRYLTVSCKPTALPDRALTRAEVEKLWGRDRVALSKCGYSLGGLIGFYTELKVRLSAADH